MSQPHGGAISFASVAPQGALAAIGDQLIVPNGRSLPACFDRTTGELRYFHLSGSSGHQGVESPNRKLEGGAHVSAIGKVYFNHRGINTGMYDLATGDMLLMWQTTTYPVLTEDICYFSGKPVVARSLKDLRRAGHKAQLRNRRTGKMQTIMRYDWQMDEVWQCPVDGSGALIKAGNRLYAGGKNVVSAIDLRKPRSPAVAWSQHVDGTVARIIAADDRLFVVTLEGRIYAFGSGKKRPDEIRFKPTESPITSDVKQRAKDIAGRASIHRGICLMFGLDDGSPAEALVRTSQFRVVGVDPDVDKVAALRRRFDDADLYGTRLSVHAGDPVTFRALPYVAALIVCGPAVAPDLARNDAALMGA